MNTTLIIGIALLLVSVVLNIAFIFYIGKEILKLMKQVKFDEFIVIKRKEEKLA
jgi:hypothetical protein